MTVNEFGKYCETSASTSDSSSKYICPIISDMHPLLLFDYHYDKCSTGCSLVKSREAE